MDNMTIYNAVRNAPETALKPIQGGRMSGKTDINPMWRLKKLTEQFGPCGIGWKYKILKEWLETGANDEIAAFVNIELYVKVDNEWSDGIPGTGGSMFVAKEKAGLNTSDECFKMALTDAISVACKALGVAADVYWNKDNTKYDQHKPEQTKQTQPVLKCADCGKPFEAFLYHEHQFDAKSAYNSAAKKCSDGKARCKACRIRAGYPA